MAQGAWFTRQPPGTTIWPFRKDTGVTSQSLDSMCQSYFYNHMVSGNKRRVKTALLQRSHMQNSKLACLTMARLPLSQASPSGFTAKAAVGQSLLGHQYQMGILYVKGSEMRSLGTWKAHWFLKAGIMSTVYCIQMLPFCFFQCYQIFFLHSGAETDTSHKIK